MTRVFGTSKVAAINRLCIAVLILTFAATSTLAQEPITGNVWAHDPSTMIKDGNRYYIFTTGSGIPNKYSTDLRNWSTGSAVYPGNTPPAWAANAVPGHDPGNWNWAPDVAYFNGKYHLYYSVSQWGTIDSVIGLFTSPSLISPTWTDQGKVVQSDAIGFTQPETDTTAYNCIDPAILVDTNGTVWMVFGSYSSGILVTQLDPSTGKRLNTNSLTATLVANNTPGGGWGSSIEGAFLYQRDGYYYLFVNYGGCCSGIDSTYNIRVGRSPSVTGPYTDRNGINMVNGGGTMLLESTGKYIGPGHPGILNDNGTNWFTYHYYDASDNGAAKLGLNRIYWTNGWPALTNDWSAFYTLDVDARDHRGTFSGTLQAGAAPMTDPARGKVLNLDGATNRAMVNFAAANASTFMAWVKWDGGGDWQRIFDFGTDTAHYFFLTPRAVGGKMRFAIRNGGTEQSLEAPGPLPTNSWCHVAVSLNGQSTTLFLNGEPVATTNTITLRPWQVLARTNYIGDSQFAADPLFDGQIDSLRVFGRALTSNEVRELAWAHPALAHRYSFNGSPNDSIGMAHGQLYGNATITNNALKLTGANGGYVGLPGGLVSWCSAVTFEFWATFGNNANWARVFDFGNSSGGNGSQYVFFSPRSSFGTQRFEISTGAGIFTRDPAPTLENRSVHVVCILDPVNNYAAIYTNGVLEMEAVSPAPAVPPLTGVNANLGYLGRSLFSSDGWLNATLEEFRIYDGRLSPVEIAASLKAGPDALALPVALEQSLANGNVQLSWPSYAAGFALEGADDVSAGSWTTAGGAVITNGNYRATLPATNMSRYFRLRR
jgi:hypothetical protein